MNTIDKLTLEDVLKDHRRWLDTEGREGQRAVLNGVSFSGMNLRGKLFSNADLSHSYFYDADLRGANLGSADLYGSEFHYTDMRGANLSGANIRESSLDFSDISDSRMLGSNLTGSSLKSANLARTDLSFSTLVLSDFYSANLTEANLFGSDLSGANLLDAKLYAASLSNATLNGARIFVPMACPEEGAFIGYKKAKGYIVKLKIPARALRSSGTSRKCRCSKAKVLSITTCDGSPTGLDWVRSNFDPDFIYEVGKTVEVKDFCTDRWKICAPGIHFFLNRSEAVQYDYN